VLSLIVVPVALALAAYLAFSKRLTGSGNWQATVTPLASIMGSGFLVSAPLLGSTVGVYALFCMAALLLLSYGVGAAIRFNIRHFEPIEYRGRGPAQALALLSRVVLAGAYFVSVTYYLQLLAVFVLNSFGASDERLAHTLTTSLLIVIAGVGMWRGLETLTRVEKYTVALNLGMIGALLLALAVHNLELVTHAAWHFPDLEGRLDLHDLRVLLGLLIVVQGFETSRYLGDDFPAEQRIATMRQAQLLSGVIYLIFIALVTVLFASDMGADVTGIIKMTAPVATVLPVLLSIAAVGSQFSAAVADAEGAGGLLEDLTEHKVPIRFAYLLLLLVTVALTWETNVNGIIAYASRAFALYYTLQCMVALTVAAQTLEGGQRSRSVGGFALLALLCLLVFVWGLPAE